MRLSMEQNVKLLKNKNPLTLIKFDPNNIKIVLIS